MNTIHFYDFDDNPLGSINYLGETKHGDDVWESDTLTKNQTENLAEYLRLRYDNPYYAHSRNEHLTTEQIAILFSNRRIAMWRIATLLPNEN